MYEKGKPVEERTDPLRHSALLGSLNCWLCGAGAFMDCDITAHQEYANARYSCSVCSAPADEVCRPECTAANTLVDFLEAVQGL